MVTIKISKIFIRVSCVVYDELNRCIKGINVTMVTSYKQVINSDKQVM